MSELNAVNKALPQYTTTASSETTSATDLSTAGSSTTSLQTPTVTPPSPEGNPNIWNHDHRANGTVFIAVGAVVGAIFVAMLLWTVISSHLSRRIAKKTLLEDSFVGQRRASTGDYDDGDDKMFLAALGGSDEEKVDEKTGKNRLSLFMGGSNLKGSSSWDSLPEYVPELSNYAPQERLNLLQDYPRYNRNSLFISPTLEVAQQQGHRSRIEKSYHQSSLSTGSVVSSDKSTPLLINDLHRPERAASPERKEKKTPGGYHKRNNSSLAVSTVESNSNSGGSSERKPRDKKKTPSMYLDDMLKGGEDSI